MSDEIKDAQTGKGKKETSSYRSIFKATSLFGGVQIYQILINIVKTKFIAILLGPEGLGIQGLYLSAIQLIQNLTSFGLSQSAVRDISEAKGTGDIANICKKVTVLQKLVWITGLLGTIAVAILSPILSKATFGNYDYTIPIIILSITLLLDQLCAGQKVVLQGMRKLKDLAKASAYGSTIGLLVSIPLYFLLGIDGIVPTLILSSATSLILSWHFSRRVKVEKITMATREVVAEGKVMVRMGIAMSVSGIMSVVAAYVLRSFIRMEGGTEAVGIFTAGYALMNTYVGLIFTAMSTDFYPRLAAVNKDNEKCSEVINQQGEIGVLILAPLLILCVALMPYIIRLLYSSEFLLAYDYIIFVSVGMMFRFASVLTAHLFLAKGSSKLYIINELAVSTYGLVFNLIGFKYWGIMGLGISFVVYYFIYMVQVYMITSSTFNYRISKSFSRIYLFQLFLLLLTFVAFMSIRGMAVYLIGSVLFIISLIHSLEGLNDRMHVVDYIRSKRWK